MGITQGKSKQKESGGKYAKHRKKRAYEFGRQPTMTRLGERRTRTIRVRGGNYKQKCYQANMVNLYAPADRKHYRVQIQEILENAANRHFVRRNVITKGTVVNTEKGKARITSRPGQYGTINAVLVE